MKKDALERQQNRETCGAQSRECHEIQRKGQRGYGTVERHRMGVTERCGCSDSERKDTEKANLTWS